MMVIRPRVGTLVGTLRTMPMRAFWAHVVSPWRRRPERRAWSSYGSRVKKMIQLCRPSCDGLCSLRLGWGRSPHS